MSYSSKRLLLELILFLLVLLIIILMPLWLRQIFNAFVSAFAIMWWINPYIADLIVGKEVSDNKSE